MRKNGASGDSWLNICSGFNAGGQDTTDITDTIISQDLTLVNYGAKVLYITNPLHTPRAPYYLDRRQKSSGYSFMVGGSIQRTRLRSRDSTLNFNNRLVDYIGDNWAWNITLGYEATIGFINQETQTHGFFKILGIRRF